MSGKYVRQRKSCCSIIKWQAGFISASHTPFPMSWRQETMHFENMRQQTVVWNLNVLIHMRHVLPCFKESESISSLSKFRTDIWISVTWTCSCVRWERCFVANSILEHKCVAYSHVHIVDLIIWRNTTSATFWDKRSDLLHLPPSFLIFFMFSGMNFGSVVPEPLNRRHILNHPTDNGTPLITSPGGELFYKRQRKYWLVIVML